MNCKERFYSPYLTQFSQPHSIIPDPYNPQALNQYAYALNNPIRYNDPSGHCVDVDEGLCVRQSKDKTYRVVHGGKVFPNPVEVAFANYYFSGSKSGKFNSADADSSYIENLPLGYEPNAIYHTAKAVGYYWGLSNFNPIWDLALDPSVPAGVTVGLATAFSWRPGQSPQVYIKGLEGVDPNAHAWDKHGPDASDANLMQESLKNRAAQTKFTSGDEMAKGNVAFTDGPTVNYSGYYQGSAISGQGATTIVIRFNGNGGWALHTAYPVHGR